MPPDLWVTQRLRALRTASTVKRRAAHHIQPAAKNPMMTVGNEAAPSAGARDAAAPITAPTSSSAAAATTRPATQRLRLIPSVSAAREGASAGSTR